MKMFKCIGVTSAMVLIVTCMPIGCLESSPVNSPGCGRVRAATNTGNSRIIGGKAAAPGSWPWQVRVYAEKESGQEVICGGSVVNSEFILTAAHCLEPKMFVVAGEHNIMEIEISEQSRNVEEQIWHEHYAPGPVPGPELHDIALLKLEKPLEFNEFVRPVCIPANFDLGFENITYITGWGHTDPEAASVMQEAMVPVVDSRVCKESFNLDGFEAFCAGYRNYSVGICNGDSGGPLVVMAYGSFYQLGVASFRKEGCHDYTVYTKVPYYLDWIEDKIRSYSE